MQCPKCRYEPTLTEVQKSPDDCVKCGTNYADHALHVAYVDAQRKAERSANQAPSGMTNCSDCGRLISKKARACPSCGSPRRAPTSVITWIVLVVIVLTVIGTCSRGGERGGAQSGPKCGGIMAYVMAGNFVKERLKSPTTAKFPNTTDRGVSITPLGDCRFSIEGYVDSQNGFGAMIRSRFSVTMSSDPDGRTWRATDLIIE